MIRAIIQKRRTIDNHSPKKAILELDPIKYYFVVASNKFLLKEEPVEEVLRERVQHYRRMDINIDFWLIKGPTFLTAPNFLQLRSCLPIQDISQCTAIISTNERFVRWLKLRYNNVAIGHFYGPTSTIPSPLGTCSKTK